LCLMVAHFECPDMTHPLYSLFVKYFRANLRLSMLG
jgi:hypothetical protein